MEQQEDFDWFDESVGAVELKTAENTCLQVLLEDFELSAKGFSGNKGLHLRVDLAGDMPTIRRREQRHLVKARIAELNNVAFETVARDEQKLLEAVVFTGESQVYSPPKDERRFVFRYASGGALPIAKIGKQHFFCLFYRDVEPWGWNIANGSCDTVSELRNPVDAVRREFAEELIVLHRGDPGKDFQFQWADDSKGGRLNHPVFFEARRLWDERFMEGGIEGLDPTPLPVRSLPGPDSLAIEIDGDEKIHHNVFLNINAADFGIEIDKIGVFEIGHDCELLDGEIVDGRLLNRPIGLFDIGRVDEILQAEVQVPDWIFFRGICSGGAAFEKVTTQDFRQHLEKQPRIRTEEKIEKWLAQSPSVRHGLCPVTRQILDRFRGTDAGLKLISKSGSGVSCFISHATADLQFAQLLHKDLLKNGISCWFAPEDMMIGDHIMQTVNEAIRLHDKVVVILSTASIESTWVEHEVSRALDGSAKRGRNLLFPIRIDDAVMECPSGWANELRTKQNGQYIGDFTNWKDAESYDVALKKLVLALQGEGQAS